ncbi:MAG TPA: Gfo/Idh/MocA family oxidoreductase [Opitutus sp.]|nr:Gfo/Idh/MocA family oxidoreductase [Opitutus sp.]
MKKVSVGILGCGAIAPAYLKNLRGPLAGTVEVVACADTVAANAAKCAGEFGGSRTVAPDVLLADPQVELVVNLTPAPAHHATSLSVLRAGKHLFSEKPLALTREQGREILALAAARGLQVGGAADTFLGAATKLCRTMIDAGRIGTPVAAQIMIGARLFHSERYHEVFRGALLDLGPYYLTALVALLGPVRRVGGAAEIRFREKPHAAGTPGAGTTFKVDIPTSVSAALDLADGSVASLVASCDTQSNLRHFEIFGTEGSLVVPDNNRYTGTVVHRRAGGEEWFEEAPGFGELGRGLGVAEMAVAIRGQRAPRASGALMFHVLDTMLAVHDSSAAGRHVVLGSTAARPEPFDYASLPAADAARRP